MTVNSCPNCQGSLSNYSSCFDCKQVIQWICYKCQWESNLSDHNGCHNNVSVTSVSRTNFPKVGQSVFDAWKSKTDELSNMTFQMAVPVLNLVH